MTHRTPNDRLRAALAERGWTHEDCARRAHVRRETITRVCNGTTRPHRVTAQAIAAVLEVEPAAIFDHLRPTR